MVAKPVDRSRLLTCAAVARRLGVSADAVRRWAAQGALPSLRLPSGQRRYEPIAVQRFVAHLQPAASVPGHERTAPPWSHATFAAAAQLLTLPPNWNSYGSPTIDPRVIARALSLLTESMPDDAPPPLLVPTHDGGVQLEWHTAGHHIEVYLDQPSGYGLFWEDRATGEQHAIEHNEAAQPLRKVLALLSPCAAT